MDSPIRVVIRLLLVFAVACVFMCGSQAWAGPWQLILTESRSHIGRYDGQTGAYLGALDPAEGFSYGAGVAAGADGYLYVNHYDGFRVLRYNPATGEYLGELKYDRELRWPDGLCTGPDGLLYVSCNSGGVHRVDPVTQEHLGVFAAFEEGALAVDCTFGPDGDLYVSCLGGDLREVRRFDGETGDLLGAIQCENQFLPNGITFGPDGNLYVADFRGTVVERFDVTTGESLGIFAEHEQLYKPEGIRFGPDGHLYVTSQNPNGVLKFDGATGDFIDVFLQTPSGDAPTKMEFVYIPEPGSLIALISGFCGLGGLLSLRRRRRG